MKLAAKEPVVVAGALGVLARAFVGLAVAFGAHVSDVQMTAIDVLVGAAVTVATVVFARSKVTPLPPPPPQQG